MRICYVITSLKIGGAEVALTRITKKMQEKGHDIFVAFFHDGPMRQILSRQGIVPVQIKGYLSAYDPLGWWQLYCFLAHLKPDLIHASLWSANLMTRLLVKKLKIPLVSELHGNCGKEGFVRNIADTHTAHLATVTSAVSPAVASSYKAMVGNRLKNPLVVISNGVEIGEAHNTSASVTRAELGIPANAFVIGSVGRLEEIKGYELLIQAFALLPSSCWLVVAGCGSQEKFLIDLAHKLGVNERCLFIGFCNNTLQLYPMFTCFALSSHSEGLSLALLEAMASGTPSITTHNSLEHDLIKPMLTGLIVTNRNAKSYAAELLKLYNAPSLCAALAEAGKKHVLALYSLEAQAHKLEQLYQQVVAHPK